MSERPLRRGNWSVQELERLRQLLPRRGVADTALLLRRSEDSVHRKAMDILRVPARRGAWTGSDDDRLRDSWGAVEPRLLGPMLGRPVAEVSRRAEQLRSQLRSGPWTRVELQRLKEFYGTRRDQDLEVVMMRPRAEILAMAVRSCLAKDKRFAANAQAPTAQVESKGGSNKVPMPRWTQTEIEQLRALYPDLANLTVARRLGRTVTSVANKANQLGLKKSPHLLADIGRTNVGMRYGREPGVVSEEGRTNVAENIPGKNADPDLPGAAAADAAV
ncbi:MAG: hypothetical protein KA020_00910 [Planctomycetes bacterium]|nr:hypothetical protein [Planctomycetota bacterium]MCC7064429.1 hypothetical protein [Planctomycetota bacterium]